MTRVQDLKEILDFLPEILERSFIGHKSLICTIKLDPEMLHSILRAHLLDILRLLTRCLHSDYHGDPTKFLKLLGCPHGWTVPEHDL